MTADYAIPLKKAWDWIDCLTRDNCRVIGDKCTGHAALLEMVHAYAMAHVSHAFDAARIERRLRAAVGVKENSNDAR